MDVSRAAAEDNALFYCSLGCIQSILHAILCFLHLGLGCCADTDNAYAAAELCKTLLKLLAIEVRLGILDLLLDLLDSVMQSSLVTLTVNDGSVLLLDLYALSSAELLQSGILQFKSEIRRNYLAAGKDCDILQHSLSAITVARSLYSNNIEGTAQLVDDQSGQSLALNVLSDDEKLSAHLNDLLQQRKDILDVGDLLIRNQDVRILKACNHLLGVIAHICADIAAVELHSFYKIQLSLHGLGLLDGDNAILGNLLHSICDHLADFRITGRNGSNLLDVFLALDLGAHLLDGINSSIGCLLHSLAEHDRVGTCCQVLHAFVDHCLSKNSSGCGSVTSNVVGLGSSLTNQLCAHVLELILKLDLFCNGNTIICDGRCAVALVQNNVASLRSQCNLNGICQLVNAFCKSNSCICTHL